MKRKVRKEWVETDGRRITFDEFATACWKGQKRKVDVEFYIKSNIRELTVGWDAITDGIDKKQITLIQKKKGYFLSKLEKFINWIHPVK